MDKIQLAIWHEYSMNHHGPGDLHAIYKQIGIDIITTS